MSSLSSKIFSDAKACMHTFHKLLWLKRSTAGKQCTGRRHYGLPCGLRHHFVLFELLLRNVIALCCVCVWLVWACHFIIVLKYFSKLKCLHLRIDYFSFIMTDIEMRPEDVGQILVKVSIITISRTGIQFFLLWDLAFKRGFAIMQLLTKLDIIMQILAKDCILYSAIIFISVINNKYNIWVYKFSLILQIYIQSTVN